MVNPDTITTPETTMSQEERDKAFDKAQEEAWASQNQNQVQSSDSTPSYNTGVNFGINNIAETGLNIGRNLTSDNTDPELLNIIKSPNDPNSSYLTVPAPQVSLGNEQVVADYNKTINDYLAKYNINLKLKWVPNEPNSQTSMKYGKFYLESSQPKPYQQTMAQTVQSGTQQGTSGRNYTIQDIQNALNKIGHNAGTADNKFGPLTMKGIESFVATYKQKQTQSTTTKPNTTQSTTVTTQSTTTKPNTTNTTQGQNTQGQNTIQSDINDTSQTTI
jgi:hypothetical protein